MCEDRKSLHAKLDDELLEGNFRELFGSYNIELKSISTGLLNTINLIKLTINC